MALLETRADDVPRSPTRAFANRQNQANPAVKGSKIAEPPRICTATPDSCEPADTTPGAPANHKPDAHQAAAAAGRGQTGTLTPGLPHATSGAMAAGIRSAFGRTTTTVASDTAIALLS